MSKEEKRENYIYNLEQKGLKKKIKDSEILKVKFVLIYTPEDKLCDAALKVGYKVPIIQSSIDRDTLSSRIWKSVPNPFKLPKKVEEANKPRGFFTAPYSVALHEQ